MLERYDGNISAIVCLFVHSGREDDGGNRIYEIAATVLSTGGEGEIFTTPVRYTKTTERDYHHSGVSRETLRSAPAFEDVAAFLLPTFRESNIVVSLNKREEVQPLLSIYGNRRLVDLQFAAEFFFPHVNTASLKSLWEYLYGKKREKFSFSAAEALKLTVELLRHLGGSVLNPAEFPPAKSLRFFLRRSQTLFGDLFLRLNSDYQRYFGGLFDPGLGDETAAWEDFLEKAPPGPPPNHQKISGDENEKISLLHIEEMYKALAASSRAYSLRPAQTDYAKHIAAALNKSEVLTIEAGTGTGKTQGYLIPAMEFLIRNPGARIAISTYTKNLQEQIFRREIPLTASLKPAYSKIPVALLKGKSNYICAEKLDHAYEDTLTGGRLLLWLYFVNKIFHFRQVDGDTVGERVRLHLNDGFFYRRLQHEISARSGCTHRHRRCPSQVVVAEALNARLVITNHHKLALLNRDDALAGIFNNCIIDEATHFEHAARGAFALEISSRDITDTMAYLETALHRISVFDQEPAVDAISEALETISALREDIHAFSSVISSVRGASRKAESALLPAEHPVYREGKLEIQLRDMRKTIRKLINSLSFLKDSEYLNRYGIHVRTRERMRTALQDMEDYAEAIKATADASVMPEYVVSAVLYIHHWTISTRAVEVAEILRSNLYSSWQSVIFTSATLRHGKSFDSFMEIAGMKQKKHPASPETNPAAEKMENGDDQAANERTFRFEAIPSPFTQGAFVIRVPQEAISGSYESKPLWLSRVADLLPGFIRTNRGRTLVLFASYSDLMEIAARTEDRIRAYGYPLLLQEPGMSTASLVEEFREIRESVLFGVDTFWFGVDFPGDTLTQVIITRLPYPHPQDPLQIARRNILSEREYWQRYRYETEIKLKQGIGRLIRSETDTGQVIILDSRYRKNNG